MSDKFIREIEEILENAERIGVEDCPRSSGGKNEARRLSSGSLGILSRLGSFLRISPGKVMLAGISLLLVALLLNAVIPGRVHLLVWAGLVLFVIAYGLFFVKPNFQYEKRWRGRLVEERLPLWEKVRRWFRG